MWLHRSIIIWAASVQGKYLSRPPHSKITFWSKHFSAAINRSGAVAIESSYQRAPFNSLINCKRCGTPRKVVATVRIASRLAPANPATRLAANTFKILCAPMSCRSRRWQIAREDDRRPTTDHRSSSVVDRRSSVVGKRKRNIPPSSIHAPTPCGSSAKLNQALWA